MYTKEQTAELLQVSEQTVRQYVSNGTLAVTDNGHITHDAIEAHRLTQDPDLPFWREVRAWAVESNLPGVTDKTRQQILTALDNRVKVRGHRRGQETADKLGVTRERVRYLLQLAQLRYYKQSLYKE